MKTSPTKLQPVTMRRDKHHLEAVSVREPRAMRQTEAADVASRLFNGRIINYGTPEEINDVINSAYVGGATVL